MKNNKRGIRMNKEVGITITLKEYEELSITKKKYEKLKEVIDEETKELFILKDMIYKPETREENFEIQRKISSIITRLNSKEVE